MKRTADRDRAERRVNLTLLVVIQGQLPVILERAVVMLGISGKLRVGESEGKQKVGGYEP